MRQLQQLHKGRLKKHLNPGDSWRRLKTGWQILQHSWTGLKTSKMPPNLAQLAAANRKNTMRLKAACTNLELLITALDNLADESAMSAVSDLSARDRLASAALCEQCKTDMEQLPVDNQSDYVCPHMC